MFQHAKVGAQRNDDRVASTVVAASRRDRAWSRVGPEDSSRSGPAQRAASTQVCRTIGSNSEKPYSRLDTRCVARWPTDAMPSPTRASVSCATSVSVARLCTRASAQRFRRCCTEIDSRMPSMATRREGRERGCWRGCVQNASSFDFLMERGHSLFGCLIQNLPRRKRTRHDAPGGPLLASRVDT